MLRWLQTAEHGWESGVGEEKAEAGTQREMSGNLRPFQTPTARVL
jgi:hypothetical protein